MSLYYEQLPVFISAGYIVAFSSISLLTVVPSYSTVLRKKRDTLSFGTIRLKWKTDLKQN
jgi:hypothetical protein